MTEVPLVDRLAYVLHAYEDSHAQFGTLTVARQGDFPTKQECSCQLCKDARMVLSDVATTCATCGHTITEGTEFHQLTRDSRGEPLQGIRLYFCSQDCMAHYGEEGWKPSASS